MQAAGTGRGPLDHDIAPHNLPARSAVYSQLPSYSLATNFQFSQRSAASSLTQRVRSVRPSRCAVIPTRVAGLTSLVRSTWKNSLSYALIFSPLVNVHVYMPAWGATMRTRTIQSFRVGFRKSLSLPLQPEKNILIPDIALIHDPSSSYPSHAMCVSKDTKVDSE